MISLVFAHSFTCHVRMVALVMPRRSDKKVREDLGYQQILSKTHINLWFFNVFASGIVFIQRVSLC
jgi:hypothetical protein